MSDYQRVYTDFGKVAHLSAQGTVSACRLWCPGGFLGTGTQDEYEKAASLPLCKNCERKNVGTS